MHMSRCAVHGSNTRLGKYGYGFQESMDSQHSRDTRTHQWVHALLLGRKSAAIPLLGAVACQKKEMQSSIHRHRQTEKSPHISTGGGEGLNRSGA